MTKAELTEIRELVERAKKRGWIRSRITFPSAPTPPAEPVAEKPNLRTKARVAVPERKDRPYTRSGFLTVLLRESSKASALGRNMTPDSDARSFRTFSLKLATVRNLLAEFRDRNTRVEDADPLKSPRGAELCRQERLLLQARAEEIARLLEKEGDKYTANARAAFLVESEIIAIRLGDVNYLLQSYEGRSTQAVG